MTFSLTMAWSVGTSRTSPAGAGPFQDTPVPAGAVHAVRNVGSGNAAELATYVVEKGKPILTLVE